MKSWMRPYQTPLVVCLALGHLVFLVIISLRAVGSLESLELTAYDLSLRIRPQRESDQRIVLIGVNEQDIQQWGWPLSDAKLAEALAHLISYQPQVIGLDIYRDKAMPPGHNQLEAILLNNKHIITANKFGAAEHGGVPPPPMLTGTPQVGFVDILVDPGGIVRRGLLFLDDGYNVEYAFPLRLALHYLAAQGTVLRPGISDPDHLQLGQVTLPPLGPNDGPYKNADARGYQWLLDFQGAPEPFRTFSLTELLAKQISREAIQGKVAIIGVTAESVKDYFFTPFSRGLQFGQHMSGIRLHGHATSQLLRTGLEGTPPISVFSEGQETLWTWLWTIAGALFGLWLRAAWRFFFLALAGLVLLVLLCYLGTLMRWWLPVVPPAMGWLIAAALVTAHASSREKAQRLTLMQIFSHYVAKDVAESIWQQREQFMENGRPRTQQLTATVLFSDIRGFTKVSEKLEPKVLMSWLNAYLDSMAHVVIQYGGVLDKFIGDAVMVIFGVPVARTSVAEIQQDAIHAVDCALAMERELYRLNRLWKRLGFPTIGIRIGIFTGPLVAGSLGSDERLEYTVIGDTVNIAARLESLDKDVSDPNNPDSICRILVGETTYQHLGNEFHTHCVGKISLKGKEEKITVYRVIGRHKDTDDLTASEAEDTRKANWCKANLHHQQMGAAGE